MINDRLGHIQYHLHCLIKSAIDHEYMYDVV